MTLLEILEERLRAGCRVCGIAEDDLAGVGVTQAADLRFGDYQSNAAMVLAKGVQQNPRSLAEALAEAVEVSEIAEVEIAGPGFLNFRINPATYAGRLGHLLEDEQLGVARVADPLRIVIDFSAPHVAKPMHQAHVLRSQVNL